MPQTQLDNELQAYLRGRRDEMHDFYRVLEKVRVLGLIDIDTANSIIDHLAIIDRRPPQMQEDGE